MTRILTFLALALAVLGSAASAQFGMRQASAELYTRVAGDEVRVAIEIDIGRGWHLYHTELGHPDAIGRPTRVELEGTGITWSAARFPEPHELPQPQPDAPDVFILSHEGRIVVQAAGRLDSAVEGATGEDVTATVSGLTCNDTGCVPYSESLKSTGSGRDALFDEFPEELFESIAAADASAPDDGGEDDGDDDGEDGAAAPVEAAPDPGAHAGTDEADVEPDVESAVGDGDDGLAGFLWLAVFWGLFTLLMPCTYPMIPITISFFTKQASDRRGSVLPLALLYGAGIVAIFVLIGVVVGPVIIQFATHPVTNLVIGALFFYFAFALFGVIRMEPPRFLLDVAGKASTTGGYLGVFLMGATLVVTSFTCTAPFVGSLLSVGGVERSMGEIALGMGVFGLTMAVPFVALSLVPGLVRNMPRSGEWMNTLKVFLGFVELAAAFKFFSNSDLVWKWNLLSRELFLLLWTAIFVVGAVYLFGLFPGKRTRPGGLRVLSATLVLAFSGYCAWGLAGRPIDSVMTAIVPNYSGGLVMPEWKDFSGESVVVVDDYDEAVQVAADDDKMLLVNFTGHT